MIGTLAMLLAFQLAGEVLARLAGIPVPGPVLGMALLFAVLVIRGGLPEIVGETCRGLLAHLGLLFIPAGTGVIVHAERIGEEWLAVAATVIGSTALTMLVTAWTLSWLMRRGG